MKWVDSSLLIFPSVRASWGKKRPPHYSDPLDFIIGKYLLASGLNTARLLDCLISGAWFKSKAISLLVW